MTIEMMGHFSNHNIESESNIMQEFDEREVSLEKIVSIVTRKLEIDKKFKPIIMYEEPFNFYITTNEDGCELKLSAYELLVSCNSIEEEGEPYFLDIPDMMEEMKEILGGDPLELISKELKKNFQILACMKKI